MRVLLVNTSEKVGGAAIACNRLMGALNRYGVEARMFVRDKQTDNQKVTQIASRWALPLKFVWERVVILLNNGLRKRDVFQVDIANTGTDITHTREFREADVIHLHWVNQGFLSLRNLEDIIRSGKKIVVTLHDQWYFTGICHYSAECNRYTTQCADCQLAKGGLVDLAKWVFNRKKDIYKDADITFVGCSRWMAQLAAASVLTRGHSVISIPNAIDTDLFRPKDKNEARRRRNLTSGRKLILFNAQKITDERKGFRYFAEACNIIKKCNAELANCLDVVVLGGDSDKASNLLPFPVHVVPYISDMQEMIDTYNAVDIFVTPSLQDNLPNTIVEAMSCGIPCVGFNVGGIPEMIDHEENGYVAGYKDAEDLAKGIVWSIEEGDRYSRLSSSARAKAVEMYGELAVAQKYVEAYDNSYHSNL